MRIQKSIFSDGTRFPVLVRDNCLPVLLPLIYCVIKLKPKSANTKRNILTSIKYFYIFSESEVKLDVDELLISNQFDAVIRLISEYDLWLEAQRSSVNAARSIELTETKDAHLRNLREYLLWAAFRYIKESGALNKTKTRIIDKIDSLLCFTPTKRRVFKSLLKNEADLVEIYSEPSFDCNPFRQQNRFRNWLIIEILLNTGIRSGELLKLQCTDVSSSGNNFYLQISERRNDSLDSRRIEPALKNSYAERTIAITETIYYSLMHYIKNLRRPLRNGKPIKLQHGYLFVSERGQPLSANMIDEFLHKLEAAIRQEHKQFKTPLAAHVFRHTFAENFLRYLIDHLGFDMERAKDNLRMVCGWSLSSEMPAHYAARYIGQQANQDNLNRINSRLSK